jgi:hypothetical protein
MTASLLLLGACSNQAASATAQDSGEALPSQDGNTVGCTSLGGTCVPYTQGCPPPQQNTVLCENTILLCCLPADQGDLDGPVTAEEMDGGVGAGMDDATATDATATADTSTE